jgi:nucleoside 2-deoxyribosyltransferase
LYNPLIIQFVAKKMSQERINFGGQLEVNIPEEKLKEGTEIYIAGPQGFAESTRYFHQQLMELIKRMGGKVLDPWTLTSPEQIKAVQDLPISRESVQAWEKLNHLMGGNNVQAIRRSSGIVANLDGPDVDSGTASEIGNAYILGLPILGYRGDFRPVCENPGGLVNLQVEYNIRDSASGRGNLITSIQEMPQELLRIWG